MLAPVLAAKLLQSHCACSALVLTPMSLATSPADVPCICDGCESMFSGIIKKARCKQNCLPLCSVERADVESHCGPQQCPCLRQAASQLAKAYLSPSLLLGLTDILLGFR